MADYLTLFLIAFAIHLAPAFTPPTWPVIVFYSLNTHLPMPALVIAAATAAALGRWVLAKASNLFAHRFPQKLRRNLDAAGELVQRHRAGRFTALGLFVFTPLPSAQLFEAAGLAGIRLLPCTLAFWVGRVGYYSLYALTARGVQESSLGESFRDKLTNPVVIAVQLAVIALLIVLVRTDWTRWLGRSR